MSYTVMRGIFFRFYRNKIMETRLLPAGSSNETSTLDSRSPGILIAGQVLEGAGGVGSSASGLPTTGIACRKERKERTK